MIENSHSHWIDPAKTDPNFRKHRERTAIIKRRFIAISIFNILCLFLVFTGVKLLINQSQSYPPILVKTKDSGLFYAQATHKVALFEDPNYTGDELIKAIEIAYLRAGNQQIPGSEYYLSTGVHTELRDLYETNDITFGQRIVLNPDAKFLAEISSSNELALFWEAQLFSRGLAGMQSSTIYLGTLFRKGTPSTYNPTGWVLYEISEISKNQYDAVGPQE